MNDKPVLIDVRGMSGGKEMIRQGFYYRGFSKKVKK